MQFKEKNSVTYLLRSRYSQTEKRSRQTTVATIMAHSRDLHMKADEAGLPFVLSTQEQGEVDAFLAQREARAAASTLELEPGQLRRLTRNVKDQAATLTAPVLTELVEESRALTTCLRELRDQLSGTWVEEEEKEKEAPATVIPTAPATLPVPQAPGVVVPAPHVVLPIPALPPSPSPPPVAARARFFWGVLVQAVRFLFRGA